MFLCPQCRAALEDAGDCHACEFQVLKFDGIPLLVKDRTAVDAAISAAKSAGRTTWYEGPQALQWQGPYRHHLLKRRAYVDEIFSTYAKANSGALTALDIGCGDGMHLSWLRGYAAELYGSDYNLTRLRRARDLNQARCVFMADITNYPVRDNVFDMIFFNHVLEHIRDDVLALSEVYRILKPGGLLMLGTPNEGVWFWQLAYRLQPRMLRTSDHVQFYTAESLAAKCRAAGFSVGEIKHIGYGVPHWTLDAGLRQFKVLDDLFGALGSIAFPEQATSLYLSLSK